MPFDSEKMSQLAINANVAGVALYTRMAILRTKFALTQIAEKTGVDISSDIGELQKAYDELDKLFNELTGWAASE